MEHLIDYCASKAMPHKACKECITNNHKQKGDSEMRKGLLTLALMLTAMLQTAWAYDFSATSPSGHTLYYEIISGTTNVGVVRPGTDSTYNNYVTGNVVIPATIVYNNTTYNVTELRSVNNYGSFESCSGLTSVTIPNSVTSIGDWAFAYCSGLTSVTIPNSVTTIGDRAFYKCIGLTSVTIPNSVNSIGEGAFYGCSGLTSVTIPNSVTTIGNNAFGFVKNIIYNGTATGSPWGALSVNGYIEGDFVYANNTKTTLLAYIGSDTNVIIPNSVTTIGYGAFYGCVDLTSVTIPNSVDAIHDCTFQYCTGLTSVTIPNSVTYIGDIDTADIHFTHDGAFYGCTALTSITIPNSVTYIGDYTFYGCTGLTSVTLPDYIDYIGGYGNCYIGSYAFYGCSGLTSVTIPDCIGGYRNYIGNYAFYGCSGLTSVTISNSVTAIGYAAFYNCSGLTSVTIPNSVTDIADYAFQGCTGLTSVTIPNRVNIIRNYAFQGCTGLTSVTIGKRALMIEEGAFYGCNNLYEVVSLRASPFYDNRESGQIFSDTVVIPILKVPCGRADAYRSSDRWSQYFVDIEEICDNLTITVTSSNESMGTVSGSGEYEFGTDTTITATPNDGYRFVSWNDGNTDNPRAIIVTEDATYIANFAQIYTITVLSANGSMGTVSGGGEYEFETEVTIIAIPNQGYRFVSWNDGNTDNPRTITVTEDATYIANFADEDAQIYTITVLSANGSMGTVSGGGEYEVGTEITITAIPNEGYHFVTWNDGNTDNPRTITVTEDETYIASFEEGVGIESRDMLSELTFYPNPTSGTITFNRTDITKIEVMDAMGKMVAEFENAYTIDISKLAKGYYAMRITTAEGVAVRKVIRK